MAQEGICVSIFLHTNCHIETDHWSIPFAMWLWQGTDASEDSSTLSNPNPIIHLMVQFYIKNIISFWPQMAIISYPKQEAGSLWFRAGWPTYDVPLKITSRLLSSFTWLFWHTKLLPQSAVITVTIRLSGVWNHVSIIQMAVFVLATNVKIVAFFKKSRLSIISFRVFKDSSSPNLI